MEDSKEYSVFTYEIGMVVSVFAETESEAREKLDEKGGFMSSRNVELKDVQPIYKDS